MTEAARYLTGHPRLTQAVDRLRVLRARPRLMAALSGILIGFAQPPFGFLPGLFGYALLLWVLEGDLGPKPRRLAFLIGWLSAFTYYLISCFWVAEAFLVDAQTYGWMAPFAVTLMPAGLGLFWGLCCVVYLWLKPQGPRRFLFFSALFSVFEMFRGMALSGFPWDLSGATWKAGGAMSQTASVLGVYGLGFLTVAMFTAPVAIRRDRGWRGYWPVLAAIGVFVVCFAGGEIRLLTTRITDTQTLVRLVQPAVGQKAKWTNGAFGSLFDDYVSMSRAAPKMGGRRPDIVVWPEGALPAIEEDLFAADSWTAPVMANLLQNNQVLIMGTSRQDLDSHGHEVWRNSMMIMRGLQGQAEITGYYDKFKLVPFGEFTPFASLLNPLGMKALTHFDDSFTPGPRTAPMSVAGLPRFLPLICYEGIFPSLDMTEYHVKNDIRRPYFIANISNDAWFGATSGPLQHLNLASYRAIEEGLPMIRSTPTGVSAIVDPLGRVRSGSEIDLGERGFRDTLLPERVDPPLYSGVRCFSSIFIALMAVGSCIGVKKNLVK
jgi:apolipoprotein N-acyltransferase